MNFGSNASLDAAALLAEQERETQVALARQALMRRGKEACVDCGATISMARRAVYPSAVRCLECQEFAEKEAYLR